MKPNFAINGAPFRPNHHFSAKFRCFRSFRRFRKLRWLHQKERKERNQVKLISHVRNRQFRGTFFAEKRLLRNFRSCLVLTSLLYFCSTIFYNLPSIFSASKMSQGVPKAVITHAQRVCRMYKKALRTTWMNCHARWVKFLPALMSNFESHLLMSFI